MFKVVIIISFVLYVECFYVPIDQMRAIALTEQVTTTKMTLLQPSTTLFSTTITALEIDKETNEEKAMRLLILIEKYKPMWKMFMEFGKEAIGGSLGSLLCVTLYKAYFWCMRRRKPTNNENMVMQSV
jgi:hypothetical protein